MRPAVASSEGSAAARCIGDDRQKCETDDTNVVGPINPGCRVGQSSRTPMTASPRSQLRGGLLARIAQALIRTREKLPGRSGRYRPEKNYMRRGRSGSVENGTARRDVPMEHG